MCPTVNDIQSRLLNFYKKKSPFDKNIRILDLEPISDGWETEVYSFRAQYEEGAQRKHEDLILRIYPSNDAVEKSTREFHVMKRLHEVGCPVPKVLFLEPENPYFGRPFVIMEKINGRPMGIVISESPDEKRQELMTLFCKMFVDLHMLDWKPFATDLSISTTEDPDTFVTHQFSHWYEYLHSFQKDEFEPVFDWLEERRADVRWEQLSLIHWDYHPFNILLRDDGKAFVIDWGSAEISDYRFDLAWTLLLMSTHGDPESRETILNEYERIAGHRIEHIEFFDVAACLRRLFSVSVSFSDGPERAGMRPGAEVVMKQHAFALKRVYELLCKRTGIMIPEIEKLILTLS